MQTQHRTGNNIHYDCVLSAWREQVTRAANGPDIKQRLLQQERELLPAFAAQYTRLSALPRTARRAMQRQWKRSLAGVALLLALAQTPAIAATINVGGGCTLADAITAANNDAATGGCPAGSGADRVVLPRGSTQNLSTKSHSRCLLPPVESVITLAGNGSRIRAAKVPGFAQVICVYSDGNLALERTTVMGAADVGLSNYSGQATLTNTTISGIAGRGIDSDATFLPYGKLSLRVTNSTISGNLEGGLGTDGGRTEVTNSTISGNRFDGVHILGGVVTIARSTISGNNGRGISNSRGYVKLINSTVSGNSDRVGAGVSNITGRMTIVNSTITRNSAEVAGGGVQTESEYDGYRVPLILKKTLIAGNSAPIGREVNLLDTYDNATVFANNFNVFGFNGNAGISGFKKGATDIVPRVGLSKVLNPRLAHNRGPTRTHALPPGSPAIDTVSDGTCPLPAIDQRGTTRPRDGNGDGGVACDTGSVERGPRPATPARSNVE